MITFSLPLVDACFVVFCAREAKTAVTVFYGPRHCPDVEVGAVRSLASPFPAPSFGVHAKIMSTWYLAKSLFCISSVS